ncbi:MAG: lytic transglycosylase domain-containing protein [Rhodobacteraceae bacterium]|nr:MAG: lytic transglycosylase domain-containing protein [Paracoccaceae bacterium]
MVFALVACVAAAGGLTVAPARAAADAGTLCALIADASARHRLPPDYLARLIWKESRFDVKALSPKGAQGVAQFMPETARIRGLADPWDPTQAIPASAAYLADLRRRFGNLGLAAAAYNSGEGRVERWLRGETGLPAETRDYVQSITGHPADWFRLRGREAPAAPLDAARSFDEACRALPVMRTRASPWRVHLAGNLTQDGARRSFERLRRRYPAALGGVTPTIARNPHRSSAVYSVSVGTPSRDAAMRLCDALRAAGGSCAVLRR